VGWKLVRAPQFISNRPIIRETEIFKIEVPDSLLPSKFYIQFKFSDIVRSIRDFISIGIFKMTPPKLKRGGQI